MKRIVLASRPLVLALLLAIPGFAAAATIFQEDFSGATPGAFNNLAGTQFTVTSGTVDVVGVLNGSFFTCANNPAGNCVDLVGNSSGTITSVPTFNLVAGTTYAITFGHVLQGFNPTDTATSDFKVSLGKFSATLTARPSAAGATLLYTPANNESNAALSFATLTAPDSVHGAVLDHITIDTVAGQCTSPPAGMVSWWPGDGNANDIIDSNTGTPQNGATFATGLVGQAFSFDGVDDQVLVPHNANQNMGSHITIDAWINPSSSQHGRPILQKRSGSNVGGFTFETTHSPFGPDNGLAWVLWTGGTPRTLLTPANVLVNGVWQHVAATYDGSTMKIYVDGVEKASVAQTGAIDAVTDDMVIGRNVVFPVNAWHGLIDELELFSRVLTQAEIQAIFNAGRFGKCRTCTAPPSEMVGWWPGDGNAQDVVDGHDGTLQNGATFAAGRVGPAFSFNGTTQFVSIPDAPELNPTSAVTLDAWINPTGCSRPYCAIIAKSDQSGRSYGMWITGPGAANVGPGALHVEGSGAGLAYANTAAAVIPNGVFTHVAAVIVPGVGFTLYVNGVPQAISGAGTPTLAATTAPVTIGFSDPGVDYFFDGLIDEVEVFNRALTPAEIQAIYNAGTFGKCKPTFEDVPGLHPFFPWIEGLADAHITGGCSLNPPLYCPDDPVTRAQMAVFLVRGIHGVGFDPPPATGTVFNDVPANLFLAKWIEQLAADGITGGCSTNPPLYCPGSSVTRTQMAVFLLRAKHGAGYNPPPATGTAFNDVPANLFLASWIEQLALEAITGGCSASPPLYCPGNNVTRSQMAVFLVRTFNLPF